MYMYCFYFMWNLKQYLKKFLLLKFLIFLFQPAMPYLLIFIKRRMSMHLSYGFDVGRGYVAGEEEVRKLIDHLSDHKDIAKALKQQCDNGRLDVIRCLGRLRMK